MERFPIASGWCDGSSPETNPLKIFDMFFFWWKDARVLYDSIELYDLWPVTALMCLASTLLSDKTITY